MSIGYGPLMIKHTSVVTCVVQMCQMYANSSVHSQAVYELDCRMATANGCIAGHKLFIFILSSHCRCRSVCVCVFAKLSESNDQHICRLHAYRSRRMYIYICILYIRIL